MNKKREFFETDTCDRCYGNLTARTLSHFNHDTICMKCSEWEQKIIDERDEEKHELEDWGSVPEVDFEIHWGEHLEEE